MHLHIAIIFFRLPQRLLVLSGPGIFRDDHYKESGRRSTGQAAHALIGLRIRLSLFFCHRTLTELFGRASPRISALSVGYTCFFFSSAFFFFFFFNEMAEGAGEQREQDGREEPKSSREQQQRPLIVLKNFQSRDRVSEKAINATDFPKHRWKYPKIEGSDAKKSLLVLHW